MDEEIEAPEEALEAMVAEDGDDDLGDALTQKCPRGGDGGGTVLVAS